MDFRQSSASGNWHNASRRLNRTVVEFSQDSVCTQTKKAEEPQRVELGSRDAHWATRLVILILEVSEAMEP